MRGAGIDPPKLHAGKPALENILADFGAEFLLHALPAFLIRVRHLLL
jgi:hypothetical protein